MKRIMLLSSGELGKELVISVKRLWCHAIAVDRYEKSPAMQVTDEFAVIDVLDSKKLLVNYRASKEHTGFLV